MNLQRLNDKSPERITFRAFNNHATESIPAGGACVWDVTAGVVDGVKVNKPAAATLGLFAGVAVRAIPPQSTGLIQSFGFTTGASISSEAAQAATAGDILVPVAGQWHLIRSAAGDGKSGVVTLAENIAAGGPTILPRRAFIRAM